jgi:hypothetical protein
MIERPIQLCTEFGVLICFGDHPTRGAVRREEPRRHIFLIRKVLCISLLRVCVADLCFQRWTIDAGEGGEGVAFVYSICIVLLAVLSVQSPA